MLLGAAPGARRRLKVFGGRSGQGGAVVACASAMPVLVLALAVAADYAHVSRYRTRVQLAADAASVAAANAVARQSVSRGLDADGLAESVAARVFAREAPPSARGAPMVAVKSNPSLVAAMVGYEGVAPSNFGSALGYGAIRVMAQSTSAAPVADMRTSAP
jgi:uncharacterized membrane protein